MLKRAKPIKILLIQQDYGYQKVNSYLYKTINTQTGGKITSKSAKKAATKKK